MDIQNEFGSRDVGTSPSVSSACSVPQTESRRPETTVGQSVTGTPGEKAKEAVAKAREQAKQVASQAGEMAHETAQQAKEQGRRFFEQQQSRLSERISHYSRTAHGVAEKLREENDPALADYTHGLADQLDRMAGYLRGRDLQGLFEDVQGAVRRRPEIFFGGMFVAGMAIARFLKATNAPRRRDRVRYDEGPESWEHDDAGEDWQKDYPGQWRSGLSGAEASRGFGESRLNPGFTTPASGPELSSLGGGSPSPTSSVNPTVGSAPATGSMEDNPVTETIPETAKSDDPSAAKCDVPGDRPFSS